MIMLDFIKFIYKGDNMHELVIVGAGPAGIATAVESYLQGVRDIVLLEKDADHNATIRKKNRLYTRWLYRTWAQPWVCYCLLYQSRLLELRGCRSLIKIITTITSKSAAKIKA